MQQARKAINRVAAANRAALKREKLVLDHAHVVIKIAEQVHHKLTHIDVEDLQQAGYIGLLEAADRYEASKGVFEHYAYFRIRGAMIDAHKRRAYRDDTQQSLEEMQFTQNYTGGTDTCKQLPKVRAIDGSALPDEEAAKREQARLLSEAVDELDPDERLVFMGALTSVPLAQTAREAGRSIAWARAKLASARCQLGARVQMWGLGVNQESHAPRLPAHSGTRPDLDVLDSRALQFIPGSQEQRQKARSIPSRWDPAKHGGRLDKAA